MKKLFAIFAAVAMLVACSVPALAGVEGADYGEVPWVATAPEVDAVLDACYAEAYTTTIDSIIRGIDTGITAKVWICWNGDYLYAFYQVNDPDVVRPDAERSKNPWDYDNVEFFVDYSGVCASDAMDGVEQDDLAQCIQYRIDVSGYPSVYGFDTASDSWSAYGPNANAAGAEADDQGRYAEAFYKFSGNFASDVYTVEYAIPLSNTHITWGTETIEVGDVFGINVQITDWYTGCDETTGLCLPDFDGGWAWDAHLWPNFTLGAPDGYVAPSEPVVPETPAEPVVPETPAEPVVPETPSTPVVPETPIVNAPTSDVTAIFSVLASLSAVAGLAISKRK